MAHYTIQKKLYESSKRIIFNATDDSSGRPVILKTQKAEHTGEKDFAGLQHEFDIINSLSGVEGVIHAYEVTWQDGLPTMAVEETEGISLAELIRSEKTLAVSLFLELACSMARVLGKIHKAGIVHRDIKPSNILISPDKKQIYFIDFHLSSTFLKETSQNVTPDRIEGTLVYISPEQTGRMNRSTDYRTDFYSLGITFYQMLTGRVPFESEDALELVHAHIARIPPAPHEVKNDIPVMLSKIILKLLAKTADERYRSAAGLYSDLAACLEALKKEGEITIFEPGQQDRPISLIIPEKLYGREQELTLLLKEYQKAASGARGILFCTGLPGIGKSFFIHELRSAVIKKKGYFVSGKYDQYERGIPYNALIQALRRLLHRILTENSLELAAWKEKILKALDDNGEVITRLLPELELIIGKQPEVPELGATENRNRFLYVFQNLIKVFASFEHPLVLFLDDVQWIDEASLQLITLMAVDNTLNSLLLIMAYRDNEVTVLHPLNSLFELLDNEKINREQINLKPLEQVHINELVADALLAPPEITTPLAELVTGKTEGNPFFTKQFLISLYDRKLINLYTGGNNNLLYNLEKISQAGITDNVVDLMTGRLKRMAEMKLRILKYAACFGLVFSTRLLAPVLGKSEAEVTLELTEPVNKGILIKELNSYFFSHDRVQEAAYLLLEENEKVTIHYKIGKKLLADFEKNETEKDIFELVDHLNKAKVLLSTEKEKEQLAWLNLDAGIKARNATAIDAALVYFNTAFEFLPEKAWISEYKKTLSLHLKTAESCYLTGKTNRAHSVIDIVLARANTVPDKTKAYELKIIHLYTCNVKEAVKYAKEAYKTLGINFPPRFFSIPFMLKELMLVKLKVTGKSLKDLQNLPEQTDPVMRSIHHLKMRMGGVLGNSDPIALLIFLFKEIRIMARQGSTPYSAALYMLFAHIMLHYFGDYKAGEKFSTLSIKLQEKYRNLEFKSQELFTYSFMVNHWKNRFSAAYPYALAGFENGKRVGDFEYASYCIAWIVWTSYFYDRIDPDSIKPYKEEVKKMHIQNSEEMLDFVYEFVDAFTREPDGELFINGDIFNEEQTFSRWKTIDNRINIAYYYISKLEYSVIFTQFDRALIYAVKASPYLLPISSTRKYTEYTIFYSLTLLALYRQAGRKERRKYKKQVKKNRRRLKKWAALVPVNFAHSYHLVEAEHKGLSLPFGEGIKEYDKSIELARKNNHVRDEAIANECAGRYCLIQKISALAGVYLKRSYQLYKKWGALGKVKQLEKRYPELFVTEIKPELLAGDQKKTSASDSTISAALDIETIMKAANTISGEMDMYNLVGKILTIQAENAGADNGALLVKRDDQFMIRAEFTDGAARVGDLKPVTENSRISPGVIRYVANTKEPLVLDNAGEDGLFANEPYICDRRILSVLCLPIINQTRLVAILYLENNLTTGAFSPDRVQTLQLLTTQTAISMDNARMYKSLEDLNKNLENKVEERTAELKKEKELKSRFFINLAHETKTPLTLITNYLDHYIETKGTDPDLAIIKQNVGKLKKDMLNFLDTEKIERGKLDYNHDQVFNFSEYINQKALLFSESAQKMGLKLVKNCKPGFYLKADPDGLDRIVNNLLDNAIKFTPQPGQITIDVQKENKQTLLLSISDTGSGMSENQTADIFEPFVQISSKKKSRQGIGMGLSIVKNIVDSLEGSITVKSREGKGTTFFIRLPLYNPGKSDKITGYQVSSNEQTVVIPEKKLVEKPYDSQKNTLLIVEDNKNLLSYLQTSLFDLYNIYFAFNGSGGLEKLKTIPVPDVIISDIMMDEMDGIEFLKTLSEKPGFNDIPFIFLTAKTTVEDKISGLEQGAVDYLFKPFSIDELKLKIQSHIRSRQRYYTKLIKLVEEKVSESGGGLEAKDNFTSLFEYKAGELKLTAREKEILLLLINAKEYKEIAWELEVSIDTVRFHIKNLYKKLNVRSKMEILAIFKIS